MSGDLTESPSLSQPEKLHTCTNNALQVLILLLATITIFDRNHYGVMLPS